MENNDLETILNYKKRINISNTYLSRIAYFLEYNNKVYMFNKDNISFIKDLISTPYKVVTHVLSKEAFVKLISFFKGEDDFLIRKIKKTRTKNNWIIYWIIKA